MSTVINASRSEYYRQLRNTNGTLHIDDWVVWFVELVKVSQVKSLESVEFVLQKTKFWAAYGDVQLNSRQQKVMQQIFSVGADGFVRDGLTNEKYRAITGAPIATATRDLKSLVDHGLLYQSGEGKRGLRYFVNFAKDKALFEPKASNVIVDDVTLQKILKKIARNIEYFKGEKNPGLTALLDQYSALAQGDEEAQSKLKKVLQNER